MTDDFTEDIIINKNEEHISSQLLNSLEHVLHNNEININYSVIYSLLSFLVA